MEYPSWLVSCQPLVPLESLVEEINRIYHSFDAVNYDAEHLEIRLLWPGLWAEMMKNLPQKKWRILDFGCGTGFEAEQALQTLNSNTDFIVAYDPSPEMLAQAKRRLGDDPKVIFSSDQEAIRTHGPYNLMITNSVLHHLADIEETISNLQSHLSDNAYWLSGHEPSARFYKNAECVHLYQEYAVYQERMKWFRPDRYIGKIKAAFGWNSLSATAHKALEYGLFAKLPSAIVIDRLVDFHVHHLEDEINAGRGLDLTNIQSALNPQWRLLWSKTYSYLGSFSEYRASRRWVHRAHLLQKKFPADGANFCAIWLLSNPSL
jgi:SAM-dependent methyltransferase